MLSLQGYLNPILRGCQEKLKEKAINHRFNSNSYNNISNNKSRKYLAEYKIQNYIEKVSSLSNKQLNIFNTFFSMFNRYGHKKLNPSQIWLADATSSCRNTVITATNTFKENKLIHKKNRGWDMINVESNIFKSKTCEYSFDHNMIKDFKQIVKVLPKSHPLCLRIMALVPLFVTFWALTLINLNNNINITSTKSIRSNNMTFFGEYGYDIAKINQRLHKEPTRTAPVLFETDHPGNIREEEDYNTLHQMDNVHSWFDFTLNGKGVDLRSCTESDYKILSKKEKRIAHAFLNGKKNHKDYQAYLLKNNENNLQTIYLKWILLHKQQNSNTVLADKCEQGVLMKNKLTDKQIESIKRFGENVLKKVRADILYEPDKKNNFRWIYDKCMFYKNRYKKNNYMTVEERRQYEIDQLEYERARYPYKKINPQTPQRTPNKIKKQDLEINDNFIKLIGEDNFIAYTKRCKLI